MYPLHEPEEIKKLGADWYQLKRVFKEQPIGREKVIVQLHVTVLSNRHSGENCVEVDHLLDHSEE